MKDTSLATMNGSRVVRPKDMAGLADETDEKSLAIAQLLQTAAGARPTDTHVDVSTNAGKFAMAGTVASLDSAAMLAFP